METAAPCRSHLEHSQFIQNGSWAQLQGSLAGHVELMRFWRRLGETSRVMAPTLHLGDVLVMNKCAVHSATGINSLGKVRQAWQIR